MHTRKSKFHEHVLIFTEEDILLLFLFYFAFGKKTLVIVPVQKFQDLVRGHGSWYTANLIR